MLDEGNNPNLETPEAPPPEESNNRTFLIVGGIFAALIFLTLVCGAVYALWYLPSHTAAAKSHPGGHPGGKCAGRRADDFHRSGCPVDAYLAAH